MQQSVKGHGVLPRSQPVACPTCNSRSKVMGFNPAASQPFARTSWTCKASQCARRQTITSSSDVNGRHNNYGWLYGTPFLLFSFFLRSSVGYYYYYLLLLRHSALPASLRVITAWTDKTERTRDQKGGHSKDAAAVRQPQCLTSLTTIMTCHTPQWFRRRKVVRFTDLTNNSM